MTYAIFKYRNKAQINELINEFSDATLQDESTFICIPIKSLRHQIKSISTLPTDELTGLCTCGELGLDGIALIKSQNTIKTDQKLLAIGSSYLGCVLAAPKKKDLLERISVWDKLDKNSGIPSKFLTPSGTALTDYLRQIGLSDIEIKELDKISSTLAEPLEKWAGEREKNLRSELDKYPKLVTKNF
jgi:hypothetical protein